MILQGVQIGRMFMSEVEKIKALIAGTLHDGRMIADGIRKTRENYGDNPEHEVFDNLDHFIMVRQDRLVEQILSLSHVSPEDFLQAFEAFGPALTSDFLNSIGGEDDLHLCEPLQSAVQKMADPALAWEECRVRYKAMAHFEQINPHTVLIEKNIGVMSDCLASEDPDPQAIPDTGDGFAFSVARGNALPWKNPKLCRAMFEQSLTAIESACETGRLEECVHEISLLELALRMLPENGFNHVSFGDKVQPSASDMIENAIRDFYAPEGMEDQTRFLSGVAARIETLIGKDSRLADPLAFSCALYTQKMNRKIMECLDHVSAHDPLRLDIKPA